MNDELSLGIFLQAYLAGLATVLTPCIYPLIPITLNLFGVTASVSRLKAFLLSISYVAGICATYTVLGLISAKTGALFGAVLGNFWVITALAIFFSILALYSLELVNLSFIGRIQNSASKVSGGGFKGAFLLGTVSGFVAAPCAGPLLVVFLTIAADSRNTLLGGLLLFTYAFGFGSVFLLLGTFSSAIKRLPRAGNWLNAGKFVTAALLFGVVAYLYAPFLPQSVWFGFTPMRNLVLVLLLLALLLAARRIYLIGFVAAKPILAALTALVGYQLLVVHPHPTNSSAISANQTIWLTSIESALAQAKTENKIAMVDLYADWCAACKELDRKTFPDPAVQNKLKEFVTARLDFTILGDKQNEILERYSVAGLPCILFLRADGGEVPDSRITGFFAPKEFLELVAKAR